MSKWILFLVSLTQAHAADSWRTVRFDATTPVGNQPCHAFWFKRGRMDWHLITAAHCMPGPLLRLGGRRITMEPDPHMRGGLFSRVEWDRSPGSSSIIEVSIKEVESSDWRRLRFEVLNSPICFPEGSTPDIEGCDTDHVLLRPLDEPTTGMTPPSTTHRMRRGGFYLDLGSSLIPYQPVRTRSELPVIPGLRLDPRLTFEGAGQHGDSGAPVIGPHHRVIGILTQGSQRVGHDGERALNVMTRLPPLP